MNKEIGSWNITSAFTLDLVLFHRQPVEGDNISPLCRVEKQKPLVFQEVHICAFSTRESNLEQAVLTKILSSQTAPPTDRQHLPDPNSQWSWSQRWPGSLVLSEGVCCSVFPRVLRWVHGEYNSVLYISFLWAFEAIPAGPQFTAIILPLRAGWVTHHTQFFYLYSLGFGGVSDHFAIYF